MRCRIGSSADGTLLKACLRVLLLCLGALAFVQAFPASDSLYRDLISRPSLTQLRATYKDLSGFGSRLAGSAGDEAALRYAESRFEALGLRARWESFRVTIPDPEAQANLTVGAKRYKLLPLWPNLVRTSTCNVSGQVVYGGNGSLEALGGKRIKGAIAILEFDCGREWSNATALGAKAIVFIARKPMSRTEAEAKFRSVPLDVPRFLLLGETPPEGQGELTCKQDWIERQSANVIAELPGSDPALAKQPVILMAYADSMSIAPGLAPGAEQSAGFVGFLELARTISQGRHARPIWFVVSGAHCLALQGAREFVERRLSENEAQPILAITLDLSTRSNVLAEFGRGYDYQYRDEILDCVLPLSRALRRHAEQLTPLLGEKIPRVVLTDAASHSDNRTWKNNIPAKFAFDCEPFMSAGYPALTFATADDSRPSVDTPQDTFDHVQPENLLRQVQTLTVMLYHVLNDPIAQTGDDALPLQPPSPSRISHISGFATAEGYVAVYDPAKSLVPDSRVPGSLVVRVTGKKSLMGVRGDEVQLAAGPEASYKFIGVPALTDYAVMIKPDTVIVAYYLDPKSGQIDFAPDEGAFGAGTFPTISEMKTSFRSSPIVLFPCVATDLYGLVDPQDLTPFANAQVIDPSGGSEPRNYGLARSVIPPAFATETDDAAVLFLPPGQRFQLLMGSALGENRLMLTGSTARNEAGAGYVAKGDSFGNVALAAARDICSIDQARIARFGKYRILGTAVLDLDRQARSELKAADESGMQNDWAGQARHARAAWALALRAHPILQHTATDIVNGVIFYSLLLIPFSFFFERLVFASRSLTKQVLSTVGVFVVAFLTFRLVHPAFDLVSNPAMIFVGFVMGALSVIVGALIFGKFESSLRSAKQEQSGIQELDVKRSNVAMAAFSLGISNLRRRRARTVLTTLTLVVMTFIVLSFTSVVPELQLKETPSAAVARYSGMLLREPGLEPLEASAYDALANEFAGHATAVRRVFWLAPDVPQSSGISIQSGNRWADAGAVIGSDPGEASLTRPQQALLPGGRWFADGERDTIVVPKPIADKLGVMVGDRVRYVGDDFTVIGIFDPEAMKRVTDLDGETLMPPDSNLSRQEQKTTRSQTRAFRKFIRLDPAVCFFIPAQTALDYGGELRSIAVGFSEPAHTAKAMASLMPRLRLNLYASVANDGGLQVRQFSELQGSKSSGLALVLIQIAIAAVFVLNTMVASVFERTREISIFSAIGLAPNHISTLFFAESLVYGVLGVVLGYFTAQGVGKWIVGSGAFPQLTLNFSSTSAIASAVLVIGVVMASTIYPARKAAKIAAPAMAEEALESEPEGDDWTLPLPFSVPASEAQPLVKFLGDWLKAYEGYAIGAFVTSDTQLLSKAENSFGVSSTAWLAPYDLGVSQELIIEAQPSSVPDTYMLTLRLKRLGGEPHNWVKLNRRFLTALRRQFLAWRAQ